MGECLWIKTHLKLDLREAQNLWAENKTKSLEEISRAYSHNCRRVSLLYALVRRYRPRVLVETGVQRGFSAAFMLQGVQDNSSGLLYSIDLPEVGYVNEATGRLHTDELPKEGKTGFVVPSSLRKNWRLFLADAKTELPRLFSELKEIDFFFHDSMHTYDHVTFELSQAWDHMRKGVIVCDDVDWSPAFNDFCKKKDVHGMTFQDMGILVKS